MSREGNQIPVPPSLITMVALIIPAVVIGQWYHWPWWQQLLPLFSAAGITLVTFVAAFVYYAGRRR